MEAFNEKAFSMIKREDLNGKIIRSLALYLGHVRYLPAKIFDEFVTFVLERHAQISPQILSQVVISSFELGYTPPNIDLLLPIATELYST